MDVLQFNGLTDQPRIILDLKKHIQTELQMQVVTSKSPLGWALVCRIDADPDYEKSFLGIDGDEVWKWEKEMVTYNSK